MRRIKAMKLWMRGRALLAAFPAFVIGGMLLAAGPLPAHADAALPGTAIMATQPDTTTYADDGDKGKGKKGDKGGTEPIIISPPIIIPDPPKTPPKKKN
jgi:hypothetical protein